MIIISRRKEDVLQDPPTSIDRENGDTIDGAKTSNVIDRAFCIPYFVTVW